MALNERQMLHFSVQAIWVLHQVSMATLNRMSPEGAQSVKQDDPDQA